ncbi:MAG: MBOAT family protein [Anaerolineaceae bacterium]|nr:MBOAT family protein [Anaerolineaceae bacterium]
MGLTLLTVVIFIGLALLYALLIPVTWRGWVLFIVSTLAVYWLQSPIFVRWLDFLLPTLTLLLVVASWYLTRTDEQSIQREDKTAFAVLVALLSGLALLRFLPASLRFLVVSRPPPPEIVLGLGVIVAILAVVIGRSHFRLTILFLLLVGVFVILKTDPLAAWVSEQLRRLTEQDITQASALDLNWLGFSYVAFRLLHTVRDRQTGLLPTLSLREYVTYVVFFPSFIAGPIDRAERFIEDYRALPAQPRLLSAQFVEGSTRIMLGLFKKFVIADTLAQGLALNTVNAQQIHSVGGSWLLLYGYALRLFFDFSGYSDIAIGVGLMFGVRLPENFTRPYTRTNITAFWQSWHITLSNWARFYIFSPLSRALLRSKPRPSPTLIVLSSQLATMVMIGLWHGITPNFLIWGVWHGVGLFIHKQWTDRTRPLYRRINPNPAQRAIANGAAWFLTFHFVVLGWVWFAMPDFGQAINVFRQLLGVS